MSGLPAGWAEATLSEVILPFETTDPTRHPDVEFQYVDIGSIDNQTQTVSDPKSILGRDAPSRARRVVRIDDVLFSTVRTYLKNIAVVPESLDGQLTSTGISVLRPSAAVDGRYLFNWVKSDEFISTMSKAQDGTLYPAVTDKDVSGGRIPLPPLPEQKRIVAKVDGLTARTARARADLARIPTLIARYKQRLLALAFSGELTVGWRQAEGVDDEYVATTIDHVATVVTGFTPPTEGKAKFFGGTIPFFKPTDLDAGYHVRFPRETLTEEGASKGRPVPAGSTLVTCIGATIGKTGFARVDCCTNQQINALVPREDLVQPEWLFWAVLSPDFQRSILDNSSATTLPIINKGRFLKLEILLRTLREQAEIVRRIESAFNWLDHMAADHAAAAKFLPKLDAAILAKAFRGELVPQDPTDEPATALLARIKAQQVDTPKKGKGRNAGPLLAGTTVVYTPPTIPRSAKESAMTKSRQDDDVMGKPYLANLLKAGRDITVQDLFKAADLPVADFYKQLAWEIAHKHIRDDDEKLEAL